MTARKLSVEATTIAALEDSPEPAGMVPDTSMSTGVGSFAPSLKKLFKTPYEEIEDKHTTPCPVGGCMQRANIISCFHVTIPSELLCIDIYQPSVLIVSIGGGDDAGGCERLLGVSLISIRYDDAWFVI